MKAIPSMNNTVPLSGLPFCQRNCLVNEADLIMYQIGIKGKIGL